MGQLVRDPSWRGASIRWTGFGVGSVVLPIVLLLAWAHQRPDVTFHAPGVLLLVVGAASAGLALLGRRSVWGYRVLLLISAVMLSTVTWRGGLFLGVYFLPATICVAWALGSDLLAGRAV